MGQNRIELFKLIYKDKNDGFVDLFFEELDSWFSADIACCDVCYDDFVSKWPGVYLREIEFQKNGIPLDCFYDGSDFRELFTEEEFLKNVQQIHCPRCGEPLKYNIWPYNFTFEIVPEFENKAQEIALIAENTPFLVLSHPFSQQVFEEIKRLSVVISESSIINNYFRARPQNAIKEVNQSALGAPPADKTTEGRYNHSGHPVLYLANDPKVACLEVHSDNDEYYVAKTKIVKPLKILDLMDANIHSTIIAPIIYSSLTSAPNDGTGWYKPQYVFSRFLADCALAVGFNGIYYPSVKTPSGHNLVLFDLSNTWKCVNITEITPYHYGKKRLEQL